MKNYLAYFVTFPRTGNGTVSKAEVETAVAQARAGFERLVPDEEPTHVIVWPWWPEEETTFGGLAIHRHKTIESMLGVGTLVD